MISSIVTFLKILLIDDRDYKDQLEEMNIAKRAGKRMIYNVRIDIHV